MPNSLAIVIEKLDHYQFVNSEFSLRAHLIDSKTCAPRIGEKLQLKVLLMFEELPSDTTTYKEYHPNLIEVVKNDGIQSEDGTADIRLKLKEVSMIHDERRFVICLQAYQSGAGNNLISAHSNPVTCIRHKLLVFEDPNCKNKLLINDDGQGGYMWYKDEGAKDKCIEMVVQLVDCYNNLVVDRIVPLSVSLTYSSGQLVHPQNVLLLFPERNIFIGNSGYEIIRFRVNEVSRNHRKQNFQIFVSPDVSASPIAGDISPACSVDFEVKSKRTADARNKTQGSQPSSLYQQQMPYGSEYGVCMGSVMYQKVDDDYTHMSHHPHGSSASLANSAAIDASPYVYVKSDFTGGVGGGGVASLMDSFAGSKRKLNSDIAFAASNATSYPLGSGTYGTSTGGLVSSYHHHHTDASLGITSATPGPSSSSNSLLSANGEDLVYYPIATPSASSSSSSAAAGNSNSGGGVSAAGSKVSPLVQYSYGSSGMKLAPTTKYPRIEDNVSNVDHHLWNEQCSGYAVESVREIDVWSKSVLQLVDDLLSGQQSASSSSVIDSALKIKMKFATDVVSGIGCLQSYTSYQHQYNCNHSKLLQTLQYQFPSGSVGGGGGVPGFNNSTYSTMYGTSYSSSTPTLTGYSGSGLTGGGGGSINYNSGNAGVGLTSNYQSVVSSQTVLPSDEAQVQAILVMKSVVVQLHDELDSTTDVGVPAFDPSFNLIGFYKASESYMLFRKSDKLEPLLSEMQKSQIKAELVDAIKTKSKFLFDVSSYVSLTELKNAALAAIIAKTKAEKDLIDAVSLMENLRKPYLG